MYKNDNYGLVTSMDMIICLSISKKHNFKIGQGYERLEEEGTYLYFCIEEYFGDFKERHLCLKKFIKG